MNLKEFIEKTRTQVDFFLKNHFADSVSREKDFGRLFEAMNYSLEAGGKRIRPALTFAAFEACVHNPSAVQKEACLKVAAALEMIHTYSLIHDDLPAMDNDDLRRGRLTNHKVFGDATAILAGDGLLTEAFSVLSSIQGMRSEIILGVIRDIAEASGPRGMVGGQSIDLDSEGKKISAQELERLHRHKTGCLLSVAAVVGAKIAETSSEKIQAIKKYGDAIGLAFQIADDILDLEGSTEDLGKPSGSDLKKDKSTYPSIIGMEKSKELAKYHANQSQQALAIFGSEADALRALADYIIFRKN
ncbi:MAG: polyprenyl synthetase family protein [Deltaproteobacteria bacterium]|nr:MAG: polyprenyl synthetase family protein [Deltaproteobacteria bacterium]